MKVREQIVQYKGYMYKKAIGRAYRSYWICIKNQCVGRIMISELKGGSIKIVQEHTCGESVKYTKGLDDNYSRLQYLQ